MAVTRFTPGGMGWQRDLPDARDYTACHPRVHFLLSALELDDERLPERVDLRDDDEGIYLTEPGDQGKLNSSPAFACIGLVEYFHRRILGETFDGSPYFVYEMTRKLLNASFNSSVDLRSTFKALRRYGAPPERMCRHVIDQTGNGLSDISLLGFAQELHDVIYFRPTMASRTGKSVLHALRAFLSAGFPVVMGFSVPCSLHRGAIILCRPRDDSYLGGQAVLVVGYDDVHLSDNKGALLVRSSWGSDWGDNGYGWLPYTFVTEGLAADFWTIISPHWLESGSLRSPRFIGCLSQ